jgi:hypothetical protein
MIFYVAVVEYCQKFNKNAKRKKMSNLRLVLSVMIGEAKENNSLMIHRLK